jgi:hypothetical protein
MSQIYFESTDDVTSIIDQQLESLDNLDAMLKNRDKTKKEMLEGVEQLKLDSNIQLPTNYEDVVERVTSDLME